MAQSRLKLRRAQAARLGVLLLLFAAAAVAECRQLSALNSTDVWWRIRTGQWILHAHALPHHALFARAAELPWTVSGWCTDVLIALGYRLAGIAALPLFAIIMRCVLVVVLFLLAGGRDDKRWLPAGILAAVAMWLMGSPACGPAAMSAVCYGTEITLLLKLQRSGDNRLLYALPALFFVWANFAPEFLCGLLLLLVFVLAEVVQTWMPMLQVGERGEVPMRRLMLSTGASFSAPLLAPYSYHLYSNFFAELYNASVFRYLPEMHALGFRQPRDFAFALFVLGVFFVLGRHRNLFLILALLVALPIVFRIQRDAWLALLPATAGFALLWREDGRTEEATGAELSITAAVAAIVVIVIAATTLSPAKLQARIAQQFPSRAASYIADQKLPGPLFQLSDWGGYVIFALPDYPVNIDSRAAMYGDAAFDEEHKLTIGEVPLQSVPSFAESRTLLLPVNTALAQAMMKMPQLREHYRVLYKDSVAVVIGAL